LAYELAAAHDALDQHRRSSAAAPPAQVARRSSRGRESRRPAPFAGDAAATPGRSRPAVRAPPKPNRPCRYRVRRARPSTRSEGKRSSVLRKRILQAAHRRRMRRCIRRPQGLGGHHRDRRARDWSARAWHPAIHPRVDRLSDALSTASMVGRHAPMSSGPSSTPRRHGGSPLRPQIAETTYAGRRLVIRRTRLLGAQADLWPDWRHFAFITNRDEDIVLVEAEHRDHGVVEQVISDLKDQALAHFPSGHFHANAAWTVLGALAHNLLRWTQLLGLPDTTVRAARTLRRRLQIPGRLTRHARLDASPARPLAVARGLPQRAQPDPRAPRRRLTAARPSSDNQHTDPPPGPITAAGEHSPAPAQNRQRRRQPSTTPRRTDPPTTTPGRRDRARPKTGPIGGSGLRRSRHGPELPRGRS
jgi:hypothetical protein